MVKHLPIMQETQVPSLGREELLEKEKAPHSSTLAWRIPWMEEPGRLQSMGLQERLGFKFSSFEIFKSNQTFFWTIFLEKMYFFFPQQSFISLLQKLLRICVWKKLVNHSFICNCMFLLSDEQIRRLLEGILSINHLAPLHFPDEETSPESWSDFFWRV